MPNTSRETSATAEVGRESGQSSVIILSKDKWEVAGIRLGAAEQKQVSQNVWVTGKVSLNEDRVANIVPLVEGIVREVNVKFGDEVTAQQVLAIIDSPQVGAAKLELFKNRQATRLAAIDADWQATVEANVQSLIDSLKEQVPIAEIEKRYKDKPMGSYREQLVSAYARLHKSRADYERLHDVAAEGVVPEKEFIAAKATYEADQATFQALLEQIRFTSRQNRLAAEQALEQARTAEAISETNLRIMGLSEATAPDTDPTKDGKAAAYYPVETPFAGTIIAKDAVLLARVGPDSQPLFSVADLSTVWVKADIFERYLPLLRSLAGKSIRFRSNSYPDRAFEARVFYTGEIVEQASRALPMTAVAENSERLLKPGMFVEIELPGESVASTLVVPVSALQEHENKKFVFVHLNGDQFSRRDVTVGRTFDSLVEVTEGLRDGESVVTEGGFFLKSQMLEEEFGDED